MKYDHMVKVNGKYYAAGENVPDKASGEKPMPVSANEADNEEKQEEKKYTKTEIMRMSKAELLEMAKNTGVEGADEMNGTELKEYLISVFGL